jgi:hypothetical protein
MKSSLRSIIILLKITLQSLLLLILQLFLGGLIALAVDPVVGEPTGSITYYLINYIVSFIGSTLLLTTFAVKQAKYNTRQPSAKRLAIIVFLALLLGNLISLVIIRSFMPPLLYLLDFIFSLTIITTSWWLSHKIWGRLG